MGYTHHWSRPQHLDRKAFSRVAEDAQRILDNLPEHSRSSGGFYRRNKLRVKGWNGTGKPVVNDREITFNGNARGDTAHETFHLGCYEQPWEWRDQQGPTYSFCKTARKPYDLAVQLVLMSAKYWLGDNIVIRSEGHEPDWEHAYEVWAELFPDRDPPAHDQFRGSAHDATFRDPVGA